MSRYAALELLLEIGEAPSAERIWDLTDILIDDLRVRDHTVRSHCAPRHHNRMSSSNTPHHKLPTSAYSPLALSPRLCRVGCASRRISTLPRKMYRESVRRSTNASNRQAAVLQERAVFASRSSFVEQAHFWEGTEGSVNMPQPELVPLGVDRELWETGLTLDRFVDGIDTYQEETRRRLREVQLAPADARFFGRISTPVFVLAMTEGWCGDSLLNLPILAQIVAAAPGLTLRVFVRSTSPLLNAAYQARGITHIPVFTFFDADFHEIGTWVERPQAAHERIAQWRVAHPEFDTIRNALDLTNEQRRARLQLIAATLLPEMEQWYAEGIQSATVAELAALLVDLTM